MHKDFRLTEKSASVMYFEAQLGSDTKELKNKSKINQDAIYTQYLRNFLADIFKEISRIFDAAASCQRDARYKGILCSHALRYVIRENENRDWSKDVCKTNSPEKNYPWLKDPFVREELEKDKGVFTRLKKISSFDQEVFKKYTEEFVDHPLTEDNGCFQYLIEYAVNELTDDFLYQIDLKADIEKTNKQSEYENWIESQLQGDPIFTKEKIRSINEEVGTIQEKINKTKFQLQRSGKDLTELSLKEIKEAIPTLIKNADENTIDEISELGILISRLERYNTIISEINLFNQEKETTLHEAYLRKQLLFTDSGTYKVDWLAIAYFTKAVALRCFQIQKPICEPGLFEMITLGFEDSKTKLESLKNSLSSEGHEQIALACHDLIMKLDSLKNTSNDFIFDQIVLEYKNINKRLVELGTGQLNLKLELLNSVGISQNLQICNGKLAPLCGEYEKHFLLSQRYLEEQNLETKVAMRKTNNTIKQKKDYVSEQPLCDAILNNEKPALEKELKKNPSLGVYTARGYSPSHLAIFCNFKEGVELLIHQKADLTLRTGKDVMHIPLKPEVNCIQLAGALANLEIISTILKDLPADSATLALNALILPETIIDGTKQQHHHIDPVKAWKEGALETVKVLVKTHRAEWQKARRSNLGQIKITNDKEIKMIRESIEQFFSGLVTNLKSNSSPNIRKTSSSEQEPSLLSKFLGLSSSPSTPRNSSPSRYPKK